MGLPGNGVFYSVAARRNIFAFRVELIEVVRAVIAAVH